MRVLKNIMDTHTHKQPRPLWETTVPAHAHIVDVSKGVLYVCLELSIFVVENVSSIRFCWKHSFCAKQCSKVCSKTAEGDSVSSDLGTSMSGQFIS